MSGPELVERLEADFQRLETPFTVEFDSPEDARALLLWVCDPTQHGGRVWEERISAANLAIARALNAEESFDAIGHRGALALLAKTLPFLPDGGGHPESLQGRVLNALGCPPPHPAPLPEPGSRE